MKVMIYEECVRRDTLEVSMGIILACLDSLHRLSSLPQPTLCRIDRCER